MNFTDWVLAYACLSTVLFVWKIYRLAKIAQRHEMFLTMMTIQFESAYDHGHFTDASESDYVLCSNCMANIRANLKTVEYAVPEKLRRQAWGLPPVDPK